MEGKYGEFVGADSLYYAPITQDDLLGYVAGAPVYLAPLADIAGQAEQNSLTNYYDNKAAVTYNSEGKTDLTITISGLPAQTLATLLGKHYSAANGIVLDTGELNPPAYALGFRVGIGTGFRYYWYLNGVFSGGAEVATTKKAAVEPKTYQLVYHAMPTTYAGFTVGEDLKSCKRLFGDTHEAAFDLASTWFTQVQTPANLGAPDALALSSITPADGAENQAATVNIVMTFSNAIASEAITVVKADGTIVAGAKSWDSTLKILTFNPTDPLDAGGTYIVNISGVIDIYGQELAAAAENFSVQA